MEPSFSTFAGDAVFCQLLLCLMFLCQQQTVQQIRNLTRKSEDPPQTVTLGLRLQLLSLEMTVKPEHLRPPRGSSPEGTIAFPNEPVRTIISSYKKPPPCAL